MTEDNPDVSPDLLDDLAPRYRDISPYAASGGMSKSYSALDTVTGRYVNINVPHDLLDAAFVSRLTHSIRLHAPLHHPNVLPLLDAEIGTRIPYYTTPHLDGRSLQARLEAGGKLILDDVVNMVASVARALDYCHQSDVLHCDIKPENILVFDTHIAIHNFQIARRLSDGHDPFVEEGSIVGTSAYMSPERFSEATVTASADLYSLGVTAYECLFGATPFPGSQLEEILKGHLFDPPPVPSFDSDEERRFFDDIIVQLLAKNPDQRFSSAGNLLDALQPWSSFATQRP